MRRVLLWLEFIVTMSLVGCARPPACYRPDDTSRGWKDALLPSDAPHLAAPDGIDQYRPGEPALAWSSWQRADEWGRAGVTTYRLLLPEEAEVVEIDFASRLGGAALEIVGERAGHEYPLRSRFRTHESWLLVDLDPGTSAVEVTVHHHLRALPDASWRVGRKDIPPSPPGRLYYFDPGDRPLELCEAPRRRLGYHQLDTPGPIASVCLSPTAMTRLFHWGLTNN